MPAMPRLKDFFLHGFSSHVGRSGSRHYTSLVNGGLIVSFLVCCALSIFVFSTYNWRTSENGVEPIIWILNIDLIVILLVAVALSRRVVEVWSGRKRKLAGSHLHVRLVYTFSLLAAVPAIIMTVSSAFLFHYGVQAWFSDRVQGAIDNSNEVARAYLEEHKQGIAADAQLLSLDVQQWQRVNLNASEKKFEAFLRRVSFLRDLPEVIVFDVDGHIYGRSGLTFSLENQTIPSYALKSAMEGETVVLTALSEDRVRALVRLGDTERYAYVGRLIDPEILHYLSATEAASSDYSALKQSFSSLQVTVILIFVAVALILILVAVWLGLVLSRQLVSPIRELVDATDQIRSGHFNIRLPANSKLEEFDYLADAFNKMVEQIEQQRQELLDANQQIDERRRLNEAVLKGVSSCVIAVDRDGYIYMANDAAQQLLFTNGKQSVGVSLQDVLPQSYEHLENAYKSNDKVYQAEITFKSVDHGIRRFNQRIATESLKDKDIGAVITLDDITDLQRAEKKAAWGDVARRVAHEIKNPLTPIQLSAERIKRRYRKYITEDFDIFDQCINTITKNVEDIGYMVNGFSSFARMPSPQKQGGQDIVPLLKEVLFSTEQGFPDIRFDYAQHSADLPSLAFDPKQIRQVLSNILLNAAQSVKEKHGSEEGACYMSVRMHDDHGLCITISDNGLGFPKDSMDNLLEPYVTLKKGGTGLGLAIVKKILDDHDAKIILGLPEWLSDHKDELDLGGACVVICFPVLNEVK